MPSPPRRFAFFPALLVALLIAGFVAGRHLSPGQTAGRDLVASNPAAVHPHGLLTFTSDGGARLADAKSGKLVQFSVNGDTDDAGDGSSHPGATFQNVYDLLRANYVEGVPDDKVMAHGAASAMIASLGDPNSRFLEPADFAEAQNEAQGKFAGIGAATAIRTSYTPKTADDPTRDPMHPSNVRYDLTLVSIVPGGPADKAGLRTGDVVAQIGDQWVASYDLVSAQAKELKAAQKANDPVKLNHMIDALQKKLDTALSLAQAQAKLSGTDAKSLSLLVARPGTPAPLTVAVDTTLPTPALAPVESKTLDGGVGYVKVNVLGAGTAAAFQSALSALGTNPKGIVLDLRGTVGSNVDSAAAIAGTLSTAKTLGVRDGKGQKDTPLPITTTKTLTCPVAALVDNSTSGAAELLASALQTGGVKLIGAKTFGADADIRLVSLHDGAGFTLTVGKLLTASGAAFGSVGIVPDVSATGDAVLPRALQELAGRVARAN